VKAGRKMSATLTSADVKQMGRTAGFDLIGIARAQPLEDFERYRTWLERGFHATMEYLVRGAEARRDPRSILPEARSVVVCALNYLTHHPLGVEQNQSDRPTISRFAWGEDYHRTVRRRLRRLRQLIQERLDRPVRARLCVDTAPLLERAAAARAGIGWIGKNNCLINPVFGSFLFLGELLIDVDLTPDEPFIERHGDRCGRCERCLSVCPTHALVAPRLLDARRCIAYLTIEHRGPMDPLLASQLGRRVYGCDVCQEVCPWNLRAQRRLATNVREFWPSAQEGKSKKANVKGAQAEDI
jgi:epoxyqueuosine reductase